MVKYSFIVPVYNTEKYLKKCIDSMLNQTYKEYEIIIVNDGSTDNSQTIIDEYKKNKKIKAYIKKNGGLSDARNHGVKKATGDYLIFVDSDDYISTKMLEEFNSIIKRDGMVDIINFNFAYVKDDLVTEYSDGLTLTKKNGPKVFIDLLNIKHPFEMAWLYAYNRQFWVNNKFSYPVGRYHEDFGLTPLVILKAKKISSIKSSLYFYLQSDNSIMRNSDIKKTIKKADDMLYHYDYLKKEFEKMDVREEVTKAFNSYIANAVVLKASELKGNNLKQYIKQLKNRKVFDYLMDDSISRKIKKGLLNVCPSLFIKVLKVIS